MINSKSNYVRLLYELCAEEGVGICSYSDDWAFKLQKADRFSFILGYQFALNPASSQAVCNDKTVTSEVLTEAGISCVEHRYLMAPHMYSYVSGDGIWEEASRYLKKHGEIVCKDNQGTGGNMVFLVRNKRQLEAAADQIFSRADAMAVCPYERIEEEYRAVMLDGCLMTAFLKERDHLVGDGVSAVGALYGQAICKGSVKQTVISPEEWNMVPGAGEVYPLNWKHNLGQGAKAVLVTDEVLLAALGALGKQTMEALALRFCSVDIIKTKEGLKVLEVNSGVMMEHFSGMGSSHYQTAKEIYRAAIMKML